MIDKYRYPFVILAPALWPLCGKKTKPPRAQRIHKGHGEKFSDRKRNCE